MAWGASLGAILVYALAVSTAYPIRIVYYPQSHAWSTLALPGQLPIHWYGYLINAALGAAAGMIVTAPLRVRPRWSVVWILALAVLLSLAFRERHWMGL